MRKRKEWVDKDSGLEKVETRSKKFVASLIAIGALSTLLFASFASAQSYSVYGNNYGNENYGGGNFSASASLSGGNEVPQVSTNGNGQFSIQGSGDSMSYTLTAQNLSSSFTAAHIHCGAPGQNGAVVAPLSLGSGTINESSITDQGSCPTPIYSVNDLRNAIRNGHAYVNVHTTNYPNGEIRGQLSGGGWYNGGNDGGYGGGHNDDHNYGGGYGGDDRHDHYDKNKGCEHGDYGDKSKWDSNDWDGWNRDCKDNHDNAYDRDNNDCKARWWGWTGWCWCDDGKPNYDKDHYGNSKSGKNDHDWDKDWDDHGEWNNEDHNDWNDDTWADKEDDWNDKKNDWDNHWSGNGGKDGKDGSDDNGYGGKDWNYGWSKRGNDSWSDSWSRIGARVSIGR